MADDISGPVGPVEYPVLRQLRELFLNEEPLVDAATFDDPANPTELVVEFATGLESPGRFEITWWASGAYRFHTDARRKATALAVGGIRQDSNQTTSDSSLTPHTIIEFIKHYSTCEVTGGGQTNHSGQTLGS
jgi:hypothetical protein